MKKLETVALTSLPRELAALTGSDVPSYRKFWQMVVDGHLPAVQVNGRYRVSLTDYPAIIAALGLQTKDAVQPNASRRSAQVPTAA